MRLIDADALTKRLHEKCEYLVRRGSLGAEHILKHHALPLVDDAPTVDAVPAVRCYECKKSFVPKRDEYGNPGYLLCTRWGDPMSVDFLDFCSCGERKDDEDGN